MTNLEQSKKTVIDGLYSIRNTALLSSVLIIVIFGFFSYCLWGYTIWGFGESFFNFMAIVSLIFVVFGVIGFWGNISSTNKKVNEVKKMNESEFRQYLHDNKVGLGKALIKLASKTLA